MTKGTTIAYLLTGSELVSETWRIVPSSRKKGFVLKLISVFPDDIICRESRSDKISEVVKISPCSPSPVDSPYSLSTLL